MFSLNESKESTKRPLEPYEKYSLKGSLAEKEKNIRFIWDTNNERKNKNYHLYCQFLTVSTIIILNWKEIYILPFSYRQCIVIQKSEKIKTLIFQKCIITS